jgi:hypothetical protein
MSRFPAAIALAFVASCAPALASTHVSDDHGTTVALDGRRLTVTFTTKANPKLMSHVQGRRVVMGCTDENMNVLVSRKVAWGKKQRARSVAFGRDVSDAADFCFVAKPELIRDGVLTAAQVMGFFSMPTPDV